MKNRRLVYVWIVSALAVSSFVTSVYGRAYVNKQAELRAEAEKARQNCLRLLASPNLKTFIENEREFREFCVVTNATFVCLNHTIMNYSHVACIRKTIEMLDLARGLKAEICMKPNGSHAALEYSRCHNETLFDDCMPTEETPAGSDLELCRHLHQQHDCYNSWAERHCSPEGREHYETMHNLSMKALCRSAADDIETAARGCGTGRTANPADAEVKKAVNAIRSGPARPSSPFLLARIYQSVDGKYSLADVKNIKDSDQVHTNIIQHQSV